MLAGLVFREAHVTLDANMVIRRCVTVHGVYNYHPRHLAKVLDFVHINRLRFPFQSMIDARYPLKELTRAFHDAAARRAVRAAIVPWEGAAR